MALEGGTFLNDLVQSNPVGAVDTKAEGDDHIRLVKKVLQNTFPNMAGAAWRVQSKASGYTVPATDNMSVIRGTAALTLSFAAVATLGNKHMVVVLADGGDVTLDPNGAELINGAATFVVHNGVSALVVCDGTQLFALRLGLQIVSQVEAEAGTGTTPRDWTAQRVAQAAAANSAGEITGAVKQYIGAAAPFGWLLLNGDTIGSTASVATQADDGNEGLFKLFWDSMTNSEVPVSGGRGASAQADWNADKTLTMPDARGRSVLGSGTGSGLSARTHGGIDGEEAHTLTDAEMPAHPHDAGTLATASDGNHTHTIPTTADGESGGISVRHNAGLSPTGTDATSSDGAHTHTITGSTGSAGSDQPHNNMQPWLALNFIVKI